MRQSGTTKRSTLATATVVKTIHTKSIFATDRGPARPLRDANRHRVAANTARIRVGHEEKTPFGTLRCFAIGDAIAVALFKGRALVGRRLELRPRTGLEARALPEADFSVEVDEFIGTPWHELEYTSLWTVHGLRTKGQMEATIDL